MIPRLVWLAVFDAMLARVGGIVRGRCGSAGSWIGHLRAGLVDLGRGLSVRRWCGFLSGLAARLALCRWISVLLVGLFARFAGLFPKLCDLSDFLGLGMDLGFDVSHRRVCHRGMGGDGDGGNRVGGILRLRDPASLQDHRAHVCGLYQAIRRVRHVCRGSRDVPFPIRVVHRASHVYGGPLQARIHDFRPKDSLHTYRGDHETILFHVRTHGRQALGLEYP